jgi:hypothetical protein
MLATASTIPESAGRDDAVQMVRAYISNIALLMNAIETLVVATGAEPQAEAPRVIVLSQV